MPQWRIVSTLIKNGCGIVPTKTFVGYVYQNKKRFQNVQFRCGRLLFIHFLRKKTGISYKSQPLLSKQEINLDHIHAGTCESKKDEKVAYLESDVLSTAFSYVRYINLCEEITGFGMKKRLTIPSSANTFLKTLGKENGGPI